MKRQDPLVGTLPPEKNMTGSPALAGQPSAVTGQDQPPIAAPRTAGSPALAPASPPGGTAQVGGAPLSTDGANERQGGAGANFDLVKDRGTPEEYWGSNIKKLGTKTTLQLMSDAAKGSSGSTGQLAEQDPEEVRRMGMKMNEAMGIVDRESQDEVVESMIYKPMSSQIIDEVNKGIVTEDDGVMRMAMTMAQVEGAENEDDLADILALARKRIGGK